MLRFLTICVLAGALAAAGCGRGEVLYRTKGRVTKGGDNFVPPEGQYLQIVLTPIPDDGTPPQTQYFAAVDQESGTFTAAGAQLKGVPPGRYRVSVELMKSRKDEFGGRFDADRSPFIFEIDEGTEEIVIDVDTPLRGSPAAVSALVVPIGD